MSKLPEGCATNEEIHGRGGTDDWSESLINRIAYEKSRADAAEKERDKKWNEEIKRAEAAENALASARDEVVLSAKLSQTSRELMEKARSRILTTDKKLDIATNGLARIQMSGESRIARCFQDMARDVLREMDEL